MSVFHNIAALASGVLGAAAAQTSYPYTDPAGTVWLSQHFKLSEFTKSQTALRHGIPNIPNAAQIRAMCAWCEAIGEPVRRRFGPVVLSSGFRSDELNRRIGGSSTSQHSKGEAGDFEVPGVSNYVVAKWIEAKLNYDQLILEFYTPGQPHSGWIHVGYSGPPHRNQELTAVRRGGRTQYLAGLVA